MENSRIPEEVLDRLFGKRVETVHDRYRDMEIRDNLRTNNGWLLRSDQILYLFGLPPSSPIPPNHTDAKKIGNVLVMILPRGVAPIKRRVVAQCPTCLKLVCAGHLDQHMRVHR